ncbi:MAG: hypothetical protein AB7U38_08505 [Hyphomicrobiales bacterium]
MKDSGRHRGVRGAFFRALFAVALLVVASLQPGMMTMAKAAVASTQVEIVQQDEPHDHVADTTGENHHDGAATADLCCDMHCMPATGAPPCSTDLAHPPSGAFGRVASGALTPGETHGLIRPPRT